MKRLLLIASILTLVVFAFAAPQRNMYWQLGTSSPAEDIMTYVTTDLPEHATDFLLEVECEAYPGEIYSSADMNPESPQIGKFYGMYAVARVDQQPWLEAWPVGSELTFTLTYIPTGLTISNTYTVEEGGPIWYGDDFGNGSTWDITDIVLDDEPEPDPDTYNLRLYADTEGTLLKDGVEIEIFPWSWTVDEEDIEELYGTYSMAFKEGGTWSDPLVIDEDTDWELIPEARDAVHYQYIHFFEWEEDDEPEPEPIYTLLLSTDPDGYIESPDPSEDPEELWGTYAPTGPVSSTGYWVPEQLVIDEDFDEWIEDEDGDFYYEFEFVWFEEIIYVDHYRVHVTTSDEAVREVIAPDEDYNGTTPYYTDYVLDKEVFYGEWKIENLSECWYPAIIIDENTVFTEARAKGGNNKGYEDRYFVYEMVFQRGENQTFTLFAQDIDTELPIEGAIVKFNGEEIGVTDAVGAFTVYCPFNYPGAGTWTFEHPDYCEWDPEAVESPAAPLTESLSHTMRGIPCEEEEPVPVELSSFTATLTGDFFVNIAWTSQTETQMMGYRVYRNTSADQSSAMLVDHPMVPATNTSEAQTYNVMDKDVMVGETYYYWLEAVEYNASNYHGPVSVTVTGNVPPVLPEVTSMKNAYPNPFKAGSSTNIEVSLKAGETGSLTIYNVMGQVVRTVSLNEGSHTISWNGRDSKGTAVGSGIYFYKLSTPSLNQTKKMVIVK